eukprot:2444705-Rhodomonas_salina.1
MSGKAEFGTQNFEEYGNVFYKEKGTNQIMIWETPPDERVAHLYKGPLGKDEIESLTMRDVLDAARAEGRTLSDRRLKQLVENNLKTYREMQKRRLCTNDYDRSEHNRGRLESDMVVYKKPKKKQSGEHARRKKSHNAKKNQKTSEPVDYTAWRNKN